MKSRWPILLLVLVAIGLGAYALWRMDTRLRVIESLVSVPQAEFIQPASTAGHSNYGRMRIECISDGKPACGVEVEISSWPQGKDSRLGDAFHRSYTSDQRGRVDSGFLPLGRYLARASLRQTGQGEVTCRVEQVLRIDLVQPITVERLPLELPGPGRSFAKLQELPRVVNADSGPGGFSYEPQKFERMKLVFSREDKSRSSDIPTGATLAELEAPLDASVTLPDLPKGDYSVNVSFVHVRADGSRYVAPGEGRKMTFPLVDREFVIASRVQARGKWEGIEGR